jgi:membrane fusion protein
MLELFRREAVQHATRRLAGEVVLASPLSVRVLGSFLAGVVFVAVVFAATASYARKATVTGLLVPDQGMIRAAVQATGMLETIMVREGDTVERGQRLAVVDIAAVTSGGNVGDVVVRSLESERVAANARAQAALARLAVELEQSRIRLEKAKYEREQINQQRQLQEQRLRLAREELARGEQVAAKGFLSRRDVEQRRSASLLAEQELTTQRRQEASLDRDIADIEARLASIPHEMRQAEAELATTSASIVQRSADAEQRRSQFVVAPISGRIAALPVSTGQTIAAGSTVAIIIPTGSHIEAELLAPSRSIGFIKPGQEVNLALQAFPFQRFGTVAGTIRSVSTTVLAPSEVVIQGLNIQEPVYRIRVTMGREVMRAYGEIIPMQPGMLVSADIVFDRRSLLQWLFDPIYAVARRT